MKILMVNKFHYIKGGSETYYFALKRKLEEKGHQVVDFSMKDEKNFESPYSEYFIDNVDYLDSSSVLTKLKMASNIVYSREAKKKFEQLIIDVRPDIVHLHIFQHQISPSILDVCKKYRIPTVYTAHDLKMICLNYKMMHHGKICEACKGGLFYYCAQNRCVKESFIKSCINVIEGYVHKIKKSYDVIDVVVTPSEFYKNKFIEFGVDSRRLVHIPNFLDREKPLINIRADSKKYYLYLGRLSEEKGVMTLIKAFENRTLPLYIAGSGPLKNEIEEYVNEKHLNNIQLLGFKSGQELIDLIGNSKAIVIPSEWYENGPYSVIEALQLGRPVVGADIGGIPELIKNNGYLFESSNYTDLYEKINIIESMDSEQYSMLENNSYQIYEKDYTWDNHFKKLMIVYREAINKKELH